MRLRPPKSVGSRESSPTAEAARVNLLFRGTTNRCDFHSSFILIRGFHSFPFIIRGQKFICDFNLFPCKEQHPSFSLPNQCWFFVSFCKFLPTSVLRFRLRAFVKVIGESVVCQWEVLLGVYLQSRAPPTTTLSRRLSHSPPDGCHAHAVAISMAPQAACSARHPTRPLAHRSSSPRKDRPVALHFASRPFVFASIGAAFTLTP